jgi:hypothetical protein
MFAKYISAVFLSGKCAFAGVIKITRSGFQEIITGLTRLCREVRGHPAGQV